jgi:hypothetical protein
LYNIHSKMNIIKQKKILIYEMNLRSDIFSLTDPLIIRNILLGADYDSIISYCSTTHIQGKQICEENAFWEQKALHDFNISFDFFRNTTLTPAQRYLELLTERGGVSKGSEKYINWNNFMKRAIQQDKRNLVQYAIDTGFNNWSIPLREYAAKGNREMVNFFLPIITKLSSSTRRSPERKTNKFV